jgi:hypothetical protein
MNRTNREAEARARAGRSWAFRCTVEQIAHRAFAHIANELTAQYYARELVDAATRASEDEARHAVLCAALAVEHGVAEPAELPMRIRLAPASLVREEALVYEIVARCCIAETESTATLIELLPGCEGSVREVVHQIAADEVRHARLGWRFLAHVVGRRDLAFLGPHLPSMLETGGAPLFDPSLPPGVDDAARGTFSLTTQRRIFVAALEEVVFPGLEIYGVPTDQARGWLASQRDRLAA